MRFFSGASGADLATAVLRLSGCEWQRLQQPHQICLQILQRRHQRLQYLVRLQPACAGGDERTHCLPIPPDATRPAAPVFGHPLSATGQCQHLLYRSAHHSWRQLYLGRSHQKTPPAFPRRFKLVDNIIALARQITTSPRAAEATVSGPNSWYRPPAGECGGWGSLQKLPPDGTGCRCGGVRAERSTGS